MTNLAINFIFAIILILLILFIYLYIASNQITSGIRTITDESESTIKELHKISGD